MVGARSPLTRLQSALATSFTQAFILIVRQGQTATAADLAKLEGIRLAWQTYFAAATDGLASLDTTFATEVTIASNPTGRSITVDGTSYTAPQTFTWTDGDSHTISTSSLQLSGDQQTQYSYASWSDGGAQSHSITVPASNTTYTATFTTQYRLDTVAESVAGGTVTPNPVGPWHNPNQVVQVTAGANADHAFHSWGRDCDGQGNPCSVTMTGPKNATGNFPSNSCVTDLVLTNQTLSGTQVMKASNSITAGSNTIVPSGANVEFRSNTARLEAGFAAQGTFTMTSVSIPCL